MSEGVQPLSVNYEDVVALQPQYPGPVKGVLREVGHVAEALASAQEDLPVV